MFSFSKIDEFSLLTDFDPCNKSTIVFECEHPSLIIALVVQIIVCLPICYYIADFTIKHARNQQKLLKIELSFCFSILLYLMIYYCVENMIPYASVKLLYTQSHKIRQLPLDFWFLCQASYMGEIVHVLSYLGFPKVKWLEIFINVIKYIVVAIISITTICICIPSRKVSDFLNAYYSKADYIDDICFYIFHSLVIFILSSTFIFSNTTYTIFPVKYKKNMYIVTLVYCFSLLFDTFAFEWGHSLAYYTKLYYTSRNNYLYFDIFLKFWYYDFPPLILLYLVSLLSSPEQLDQKEIDILSEKISQLTI